VMTVPLIVLAVLTAMGGLINLPHWLPGNGWLHHWLAPVVAPGAALAGTTELHLSGGTEAVLVLLAVGIAAGGLVLARRTLRPEALVTADKAPAERGFAKVLLEKYYVDEIYDRVIVRPLLFLSRVILWKGVDQGLVDGAGVNGTAFVAKTVGWLGTRLQSGRVGTYVVLFVVGVLAVLSALTR